MGLYYHVIARILGKIQPLFKLVSPIHTIKANPDDPIEGNYQGYVAVIEDSIDGAIYLVTVRKIDSQINVEKPLMVEDLLKKGGLE